MTLLSSPPPPLLAAQSNKEWGELLGGQDITLLSTGRRRATDDTGSCHSTARPPKPDPDLSMARTPRTGILLLPRWPSPPSSCWRWRQFFAVVSRTTSQSMSQRRGNRQAFCAAIHPPHTPPSWAFLGRTNRTKAIALAPIPPSLPRRPLMVEVEK